LSKSSAEIFNEKVNLIYEYDKRSPLFARVAAIEIENNNIEDAIDILLNGLKIHNNYAAAHLLLARAYALTANYSYALKYVKSGSDLINSKKTYEFYLQEINNLKKQRSLFNINKKNIFTDDENEPNLFENLEDKKRSSPSIDETLEEISNEISSLKLNDFLVSDYKKESENNDAYGKHSIVSDTLAKIYIAQGEIEEAISIYKKLIEKHPHKAEYYSQRISELQG
jgi:tetratricopeptide (TPR) repeat protein